MMVNVVMLSATHVLALSLFQFKCAQNSTTFLGPELALTMNRSSSSLFRTSLMICHTDWRAARSSSVFTYDGGDVEAEAFQTSFGFTVFMDFGAVLGQNLGVFAGLSNMVGKYTSGEGMMATMRFEVIIVNIHKIKYTMRSTQSYLLRVKIVHLKYQSSILVEGLAMTILIDKCAKKSRRHF